MTKKVLIAFWILTLAGCSSANVDYLKEQAPSKWRELGFEPIAYEGYQWGFWLGGSYGGAEVWHALRRVPDNGVTYSGYIKRWGDELHVYGPRAIDAIKPR